MRDLASYVILSVAKGLSGNKAYPEPFDFKCEPRQRLKSKLR